MPDFIKDLEIKNFKSIDKVNMDCARINLFIGKPNVGKSNILEALSLFCPETASQYKDGMFLSNLIRFEDFSHLFHFFNTNEPIEVSSNITNALLFKEDRFNSNKHYLFNCDYKDWIEDVKEDYAKIHIEKESAINAEDNPFISSFDKHSNGGIAVNELYNPFYIERVHPYRFKENAKLKTHLESNILLSPNGENLFEIIYKKKNLVKELTTFFKEYDLELLLDIVEKKIKIQRKQDGVVYQIPYSLMADTLQRIIFHFAAIESNHEQILLLEEPENHSFPPYIRSLAEKIVDSSNQYFITTHSPYLYNTIVENGNKDVAVFVCKMENHQTIVEKMSEDDIEKYLDYGADIFFNL